MTYHTTTACACGHEREQHDTNGDDTRCLVVAPRDGLPHVFDDGRDTAHGYCACLRFTPAGRTER